MSPLARICPTCGDAYTGTRCTKHARPATPSEQRKASRPEWRLVYNTAAWRRVRSRVLHRDDHTCQRCGAKATHAAHITPFLDADGTPDARLAFDPANIQAECARCNGREAAARQANHPGGTP